MGEINRIRADSPEGQLIIAEIDKIVALGETRHKECCADIRGVTHPSDYLTSEERERLHNLKMQIRMKSREEAREDILKRRAKNAKISNS